MKLLIQVLVAVITCSLSIAQSKESVIASERASTNMPGYDYPRIDKELRGIFMVDAPEAHKVQVSLNETYDMVQGQDGVWTVTTKPLVPGFHYYTIIIDGVSVADPASESFYGYAKMQSGIEVPEEGVDYYSSKDVPHGEIRACYYHSKSENNLRRCYVYTPPGYDFNQERYPVLYLQHCMGEDERAWPNQGKVNFILDNMIAEGKCEPMIVVMDNGNISPMLRRVAATDVTSDARADYKKTRMQFGASFYPIFLDDLLPFIDMNFRTIPDRDHRAMAGTSWGGLQALNLTITNPDKFAYIGGFSPDLPEETLNSLYNNVNDFNRRTKVFFLTSGSEEGNRHTGIINLHEALDKAGIKNIYYQSTGTAHEWLTFRRSLYQFAPLLFK